MNSHPVELRVGPLSTVYLDGDLRYITIAGREVVRRMFVTVRDPVWGTTPAIARGEKIDRTPHGFTIEYEADHRQGDITFSTAVSIEAHVATAGVHIRYALRGVARTTFQTNRTGLCLLHPIHLLRGQPCQVRRRCGSIQSLRFPDDIAPHSPATNITSMRYVAGGVDACIHFSGNLFEMEDQRNWCDASYKTYCRPLEMPRPYTIHAGDTIEQSIAITLNCAPEDASPEDIAPREGVLRVGRPIRPMALLGTVINDVPSADVASAIRRLPLSFIRHDLRAGNDDRHDRLGRIAALGWPIDLAIHVDNESQLPPGSQLPANVQRILLFRNRTPCADSALMVAARKRYPHLPVAGGTIGNFVELNRNRPPEGMLNGLTYGICPQIHAMDDLSIMENLAAQADTVKTALGFAAGAPIIVGPVTLHRQPDPFAAGNDGRPVAAAIDPRHATAFGAAWTIGSLKHLLESGPTSVVYYQAAGPHGLVASGGTPHPLYRVFSQLGEFVGGDVHEVNDPNPLQYKAFAVGMNGRIRLFVANVGWRPTVVSIADHPPIPLPLHGIHILDLEAV